MNTARKEKNYITTLTGTQCSFENVLNQKFFMDTNIQFYGTEVAFSHNVFTAEWFLAHFTSIMSFIKM